MSSDTTPNPAMIRTTVQMVEAAICTARHKACGFSLSQHGLLLQQVPGLYATAAWIEAHQNDAALPSRLRAGGGRQAG